MKKLLLLPLLIISCTKPNPNSALNQPFGKAIDPSQIMDMEPLIAQINSNGISTNDNATISLAATRRNPAARAVAIMNRTKDEKELNLDFSQLNPAITQENNCPAQLKPKRTCVIQLYFNQDKQLGDGVSVPSSSFKVTADSDEQIFYIEAGITGQTVEQEAQAAVSFNKASIAFNNEHYVSKSKSDLLVIRNNSSHRQPVTVDVGTLPTGWSVENNCPQSPDMLRPKRICGIVITHDGGVAPVGESNHSISISGNLIQLSAVVEALPTFDSNPNFEFSGLPDLDFTMSASDPVSYEIRVLNVLNQNSYSGNLVYSNDFNLGPAEDRPSALTTSNNCDSSIGKARYCFFRFRFDPSRFPYQVSVNKEIYIAGQQHSMTLEGDSPCHPSHPQARPDAQLGYKLNSAKTACIPNVGVFDSPDSYYGHAVFQ